MQLDIFLQNFGIFENCNFWGASSFFLFQRIFKQSALRKSGYGIFHFLFVVYLVSIIIIFYQKFLPTFLGSTCFRKPKALVFRVLGVFWTCSAAMLPSRDTTDGPFPQTALRNVCTRSRAAALDANSEYCPGAAFFPGNPENLPSVMTSPLTGVSFIVYYYETPPHSPRHVATFVQCNLIDRLFFGWWEINLCYDDTPVKRNCNCLILDIPTTTKRRS